MIGGEQEDAVAVVEERSVQLVHERDVGAKVRLYTRVVVLDAADRDDAYPSYPIGPSVYCAHRALRSAAVAKRTGRRKRTRAILNFFKPESLSATIWRKRSTDVKFVLRMKINYQ